MSRQLNVRKVPESVDPDVQTVSTVCLTAKEELMAIKLCGEDETRLREEKIKMSIRAVNGTPVNSGDGTIDEKWEKFTPRLRNLLGIAYARDHFASDADAKAFFDSTEVVVG